MNANKCGVIQKKLRKMPLVIMCGLPASGKTTRAKELESALLAAGHRVRVVNDEYLNITKRTNYGDPNEEKKARAALISGVERFLTQDDVVIADGLNYIKGFRYQLFCLTRAQATPHCVIECATKPENISAWNATRTDSYTEDNLRDLEMRYEAPNSMTKWDKPLFVVHTDDPLPLQEIMDALFGSRAPTPNLATRAQPISDTNYVFQLDQTTQQIVNSIMEAQQMGLTVVTVGSRKLTTSGNVTWAELHRHRRQFLQLNKVNTLKDMTKISEAFMDYLSSLLS